MNILKKPPQNRTNADLTVLQRCTEDIKFFKDYIDKNESHIHLNCLKAMTHLRLKAEETVFEIGKSFSFVFFISYQFRHHWNCILPYFERFSSGSYQSRERAPCKPDIRRDQGAQRLSISSKYELTSEIPSIQEQQEDDRNGGNVRDEAEASTLYHNT